MSTEQLEKTAKEIRKAAFKAMYEAGKGHFGGSLSVIEILTVLYFKFLKIDPSNPQLATRDRLVLSKGHAGPALYAALAERGYFPKEQLVELDQSGGSLPKHVDRLKVPGVDISSGSLGQGLSICVGMALAAKLDSSDLRVYTILGDGELQEGQVWEAAMTAGKYHLDNLTAIIDYNRLQIDGAVEDVMPIEPLEDKWKSFGWNTLMVNNGHYIPELFKSVETAINTKGKPTVIIARTVKGKGISFMENQVKWHSGSITEEEFQRGMRDLEGSGSNDQCRKC
jgi:transketolase